MGKEHLDEELMNAWLDVSAMIRTDRIASELTFNELFICNLLMRQKKKDASTYLTAADLCVRTRILKSQMNRCLTSLEKKGMIERIRSEEDKRKVFIKFREENIAIYEKEYEQTLKIPNILIQEMGEEQVRRIIDVMNRVSEITGKILSQSEFQE